MDNENIYSGVLTPTSGSLYTANEPDMLLFTENEPVSMANLNDDRSSSLVKDVEEEEENIPTVRKSKRNKK